MSLIVKICGLRTPPAVEAAVRAGADMVGFVFFEKSPRNVSPAQAAALAKRVPAHVRKVALLVDADDARIDTVVAALGLDLIQLHGREDPERADEIRRRFGVPVMKALGVACAADLAGLDEWVEAVDHLLIDAKPPPDAAYPGGHGRRFDWSILDRRAPSLRFMLSGGLNPGNVAAAIARVDPWGVDVSSGVESDGVKDVGKIAAFVAVARGRSPPR